jgi:hypothetical protein
MMTVRSMTWGTLAAVLVAAFVWAPRPVAGQPPAGGAPFPGPNAGNPESTPYPVYTGSGGFGGMAGTNAFRTNQDRSRISQIAQQYAKATKEDEKKEIRKKLLDALGQQFDKLAEQQQKELDDLEKQVAALRALLKKRHDARETIIDRRLEQVIQEAEGLGWGVPAPSQPVLIPPQPTMTPRQN